MSVNLGTSSICGSGRLSPTAAGNARGLVDATERAALRLN